jgi:WD40 repeat protein
VNEGKPNKTFRTYGSGNVFIRKCDDESLIAASYNGDSIIIWDAITSKALHVIKDDFRIHKYDLSRNSKYVTTVFSDNSIRIWNAQTGDLLSTIEADESDIRDCIFSPNSETIMSFAYGGPVRLFRVSNGELIREFNVASEGIYQAVFNETGSLLATVAFNGETSIWDVNSGEIISTFISDQREIDFIEFTSNSELLLFSNVTKMVVVEVQTAKIIREFKYPSSANYFATQSPDSRLLFYANREGSIYLYDLNSGAVLHKMKGQTHQVYSASFSSNNKFLVFSGDNHKTILWDVQTGKIIYTRLQLENNDWLVYDEDYRFDGSPGAIEKLYFTCGLEIIELGQMKDALYVPGLAEKLMNGEDVNYKKLSEIDICGALPLIEKLKEDSSGWQFSIQQRRWPIVRIEIKVDGKIVKTLPFDQFIFIQNMATLDLKRAELEKYFVNGKENKISISAITKENGVEIISRGIDVFVLSEESTDPPQMYMLMIGVNDYKDDALDLRFPVQDARALSNAIEMSASKLLDPENIHVYHVESKMENNLVYTTPERAGVMKALAEIGSKAKANDLLFIFFAGHGVMQGQVDKTFTFLTADASQINQIGISTNDLKSWLSPEGPFKMLPNKTILVYDACNSGQAAKELVAALTRDDDATERQRQIEELGDKSGLFILSASAPNKPAYELPQFGQGILTYSLLYTLKNNPSILDQEVDGNGYLNLQKWFLATEQEQSRRMEALGLKQDAQPYGAGNIRLGLVDNELRQSIKLTDEKPLVFCANARDENDEDPLELKKAINDYFEHALSRGSDSPVAFVSAETPQANVIKLIYSIKKEKVECRILVFKNKIKIQETTLSASIETIPSKIAEAVSNLIVH